MDRRNQTKFVGTILGSITAGVLFVAGCSASPTGRAGEGLNLREPDAAFMKRVERDPFPRAEQAQMKR